MPVAGVLGPVTGDAHIHRFQPVRVDAHPDGKRLSAVRLFALPEYCPQFRLEPVLVRHHREVVLPQAPAGVRTVAPGQNVSHRAD